MDLGQVGQRISTLREKLNLKQGQLAEKINKGQTTISRAESGEIKPSYELLLYLSEHCHVSIDYILKGQEFIVDELEGLNTTIHTITAREAIGHLQKCRDKIKELDNSVHIGIEALERQRDEYDISPELAKMLTLTTIQ